MFRDRREGVLESEGERECVSMFEIERERIGCV